MSRIAAVSAIAGGWFAAAGIATFVDGLLAPAAAHGRQLHIVMIATIAFLCAAVPAWLVLSWRGDEHPDPGAVAAGRRALAHELRTFLAIMQLEAGKIDHPGARAIEREIAGMSAALDRDGGA